MRTKRNTCVAITGTSGFIGNHLLAAICKEHFIKTIIAIDTKKPDINNGKILSKKLNIIESDSVDCLGEILTKHRCKTLIHCALPNRPSQDIDSSHELQTIGIMNALLSCEIADIHKLILSSTTEIYGALPDNPNFLTEQHPPRGDRHSAFFRDKIDAERQFTNFQRRFPQKTVTILRPCTILGRNVRNYQMNFLTQPVVPTALGFDPLMQFVHINDVIRAFVLAVKNDYPGIFNIVGDGVLPLSRALKMAGKPNLPIMSSLLYPAAQLFWYLNIGLAPSSHINFLKYQFVANGLKAKKIMKFEPVYSSKEALLDLKTIQLPYKLTREEPNIRKRRKQHR